MTTAEIKLDLIHRITNLKDLNVLSSLKNLLDFELDNEVYVLNAEQRARLSEAQYDEELSEENANRDIEQWLNEK